MALTLDEKQLIRSMCDLYFAVGQPWLRQVYETYKQQGPEEFIKSNNGLALYVLATKKEDIIPDFLDVIDPDCVVIYHTSKERHENK